MSQREIDICEDIIETSLLLRISLAQLDQYEARGLIIAAAQTQIQITAYWQKLGRLQDAHGLYCLGQEINDNQN